MGEYLDAAFGTNDETEMDEIVVQFTLSIADIREIAIGLGLQDLEFSELKELAEDISDELEDDVQGCATNSIKETLMDRFSARLDPLAGLDDD